MNNRINFLNAPNVSIIVVTQNMKNRLVGEGIKPDKIQVVNNGVNCDEFSPSERKERIVGYFGGENTSKGYKIFFKLAEFIKQLYPEVRFIATGNYRNKSEYVEFLGELDRDAFREMVSRCRCTVVPSIWEEPFSLVTLESMACGVPVVAFDVGSLKSIIVDGKTGFVVPKGNIEYMAQRIIRILNDDQLFSELSYNARQWVCAEFNESKRIYSLLEIIEKNLQ
jgi:glycosyltransferase involved in cell wall biosynthesis